MSLLGETDMFTLREKKEKILFKVKRGKLRIGEGGGGNTLLRREESDSASGGQQAQGVPLLFGKENSPLFLNSVSEGLQSLALIVQRNPSSERIGSVA